jgi:hypothetical protein
MPSSQPQQRQQRRSSRGRPTPAIWAVAASLLLCFLLGPSGAPAGEVIERILAVVDDEPILLTEVELLARVRGVPLDKALEARIDEQLMQRAARRLGMGDRDDEAAYRSLRERVPALAGEAELEPGLRRIAQRQAAILRYIDLRLRPLVRVSADEIQHAYEKEYPGPERPSLESVETELSQRLSARQLDQRIEEWVSELRSSAEIRYNP